MLRVELPGQVTGLLATLPHTRQGIVALLEYGAVMLWFGADGVIELDRDLPSPMGAFVPGVPLVLVSDRRMVLLDVDSSGVRRVTRVGLTGQFALLGHGGEITIYQSP